MFTRFLRIAPSVWIVLAGILALEFGLVMVIFHHIVASQTVVYVIQPIASISIALLAYWLSRGKKEHVHKAQERAVIIGSVLAIWFVLYFATGVFTTYVHNALISTIRSTVMNIIGFGLTGVAVEYIRNRLLLLTGRRDIIWFGVIVTLVFGLQQIQLPHLLDIHSLDDTIKVTVTDIIPAFATSALLTYLALTSGLVSQLTYKIGLVAMMILPPIIPKYDWYMLGVSSLLLTICIYLVIDRSQQRRHIQSHRHYERAFTTMWIITMAGMVLFMTGAFVYKPVVIMSDSMSPIFTRGSVVVVQKIESTMDITIGDIIQYEADGRTITHRVIAIDNDSDGKGTRVFTTKGDNNPSRDPPITARQVVGIIRSTIPYIGYPTVWLREITLGNESEKVNGVGNGS